MSIDFHFAWQTLLDGWPLFAYGIAMTLAFAFVGTACGLILGLIIGAIHSMEIDPLDSTFKKILYLMKTNFKKLPSFEPCKTQFKGLDTSKTRLVLLIRVWQTFLVRSVTLHPVFEPL